MASIYKLKGKRGVRYEYTIQVGGRQERKRFESRAEAEAALQDRQRELREGRITGIISKSFGDVAEQYVSYKRGKGKRSVAEDIEILDTRLLPFFGRETKVADITAARIAEYEARRASEICPRLKRPITPSTINRHLAVLRCLLKLAKKWGHVRDVPVFEMGREPQGRLRYLEQEEALRLLAACRASKNPYLFAIVTIALHAGMRQGEILGLTWDRVDFARGVLLLEITKSGKRREVPMSAAVDAVLSTRTGPREGLVFAKADGQAWGRLSTAFATALRRAKITAFRFHDLRHTCASWLAMSGRPLLEIKELLGHAEISMTMRYAHLAPGRLREAVGVLDTVFAPGTAAHGATSATVGEAARPAVARPT